MLKAAWASDEEARAVSESIIWASLRGNNHGFESLITRFRNAYLRADRAHDKTALPTITSETPATLVVDGKWCEGTLATFLATEKVIEKAKATGIAAATVLRCGGNGALGFYTGRMADNDLIGIAFSGAVASTPPYGGVERMFGTNPISIAVPAGAEYPILIDWATSATSWGGIRSYITSGQPVPEGMILDDQGEPTTDPTKFSGSPGQRDEEEQHGSIANMGGGHKGYAIQLAVELLGEILPALKTGNETSGSVPGNPMFHNPAFLMALNVSFFQDLDAFKRKVDERIRQIKGSKRKPGVDEIFLPGERGFRVAEQRLREGIPLQGKTWNTLTGLAEDLNFEISGTAIV
jgi:LDH2 family malate/lactate/ureidoglycolate dehydrogenase